MTQVIINDILPLTQAIATGGQTVYSTTWTANAPSDVVVYSRSANTPADDATQIVAYPAGYSVSFVGGSATAQVTLVTPSTAGDVVTITRMTPADRENLYSNTNFTPSMLNNDFGILTLVDQQAQLVNQQVGPRYNYSDFIDPIVDTILPVLAASQVWQKNSGDTAIIGLTLGTAATRNATNVSLPDVASVSGSFVVGNFVAASDTLGTLVDGGYMPGTISQINTGTGLTGGPITTSGTIQFAPITANSLWANFTGGTATPTIEPLSKFLLSANNLNDLGSLSTAVHNLGLTIGQYTEAWSAILDEIAASTWPGAASITTLGTIATGVWNGTTIGVAHGGTGNTTFTAYELICGGTTSTGAFQSVSNSGALDGSVLTWTSASTLPTWQLGPDVIIPEDIQNQSYVFATDTGTANAYVATLDPAVVSYAAGLLVKLLISHTNTTASTLAVNGLAAKAITTTGLAALTAGQIVSGMIADLEYDGTEFQLLNPVPLYSGTVSAGLINQLGYYAAAGNDISGLATANSGVLVTSSGGVPSISQTLPAAVQANIVELGTQSQALNMGGFQINALESPSLSTDAVNKAYADSIAGGLNPLLACQAATTTSLNAAYLNGASGVGATLTNSGSDAAFTVDGYSANSGDRILVKNQTSNTFQNGIYNVTTIGTSLIPWVLTRATDYNEPTQIAPGDLIAIENGTINLGSSWLETATVTAIGTGNPITFSAFFTPSSYLQVANNLSDVASASTSRTNLGLAIGTNVQAFSSVLTAVAGGTYTGATSITTLGTIGTGVWQGTLVGLAYGGTNADLTAVAGGIAYSTSSAMGFTAAGTSGQIFLSQGTSTPIWTTSTYPTTNAVSTLLYASSANTMAALATANSSGLLTNGSGVPAWVTVTGTGAPVLASTPTLITPVLGAATATSVNFGDSTLNKYKTGSFTPALSTDGTLPTTLTMSTQTGEYTQIGNVVFFSLVVVVSAFTLGSGTGDLIITGLPVTVGGSPGYSVGSVLFANLTLSGTPNNVVLEIINASTTAAFIECYSNANTTEIPLSALTSSTAVRASGHYFSA